MTDSSNNKNLLFWRYIALPVIFLLVTLLGGLRLSFESGAFLFLAPTLFNLVLAVMLAAIVIRGKLVKTDRWFSTGFPPLKNCG
jgi:small basic protein